MSRPYLVRFSLTALISLLLGCTPIHTRTTSSPPLFAKHPFSQIVHGEILKDPFHYLEDINNPDTISALRSEDLYFKDWMQDLSRAKQRAFDELKERMPERASVDPILYGNYLFKLEGELGLRYPRLYRSSVDSPNTWQIVADLHSILDPNESPTLESLRIHPSGDEVAFLLKNSDENSMILSWSIIESKERRSMVPYTIAFEWGVDRKSIVTLTHSDGKEILSVLNLNSGESKPLFSRTPPNEPSVLKRSSDNQRILLFERSTSSTTIRFLDTNLDLPLNTWTSPSLENLLDLDSREGEILAIGRDSKGCGDIRKISLASTAQEEELLYYSIGGCLTNVAVSKNKLLLFLLKDGEETLAIFDPTSRDVVPLNLRDVGCTIEETPGGSYADSIFRVRRSCILTPPETIEINGINASHKIISQTIVPHFKPEGYELVSLLAPARDGTKIPITLVRRKNTLTPSPILLAAYGAYGIRSYQEYSPFIFRLIDKGIPIAIAHVRGGGFYGPSWHEEGKLLNKRNSITDLTDSALHLIKEGITSPNKIFLRGRSAGAIAIAGALNEKSDLFGGAILEAPFTSVLQSSLQQTLPLTLRDYAEWGDPKDKKFFDYILSYSPYENIRSLPYPPMLVSFSLADTLIPFWDPLKYVAQVRERSTSKAPVLTLMSSDSSHEGSEDLGEVIALEAAVQTFIIDNLL